MKKIIYILFISLGIALSSCEDLLDKPPLDQISEPLFWQTENDLQMFINGFYNTMQGWQDNAGVVHPDEGTDVAISTGLHQGAKNRLDGATNVPASGGGWSWGNIRNINYYLENVDKVADSPMKSQYIGEGYFFRAWYYFEMLKQFGTLPIITKPVNVSDTDILYGPRSSRTDVVNFILSDIDEAISKLRTPSQAGANRLNQYVAQIFKARVALHEGTWQKYHQGTPFAGTTDGSAFLNLAATTAKAFIDAGNYTLVQGNHNTVYHNLFIQTDYRANPEVIFYKHYDRVLGPTNTMGVYPNYIGMTREMVRTYLCDDGRPIAVSDRYQGDHDLRVVAVNRDPRLGQSILTPGDPYTILVSGETSVVFTTPILTTQNNVPTGYELKKYFRPDLDPTINGRYNTIGHIIFRLPEALMIYAEARAELGQLTQADVDLTVNRIRARVGMPPLVLGSITPDPNWPDYGYPIPDYLQEIRRERTVELFNEGFRLDDIFRWRAHSLVVGKKPKGTKYTDELKAVNSTLLQDEEGYIDPYFGVLAGPNSTWGFRPDKDYLRPLPITELTLNPALGQNPGW